MRAAVAFLGHLALGIVLVAGIWLTEKLFQYFWQEHEPLLFGRVPIKWAFDAADFGVLAVFVFWGIVEANQKLKIQFRSRDTQNAD